MKRVAVVLLLLLAGAIAFAATFALGGLAMEGGAPPWLVGLACVVYFGLLFAALADGWRRCGGSGR